MLYTSNKIKCYTTSNKIKCNTNRDQKAINCGVEAVVGVAVWRGGRGGGSGEGESMMRWRRMGGGGGEDGEGGGEEREKGVGWGGGGGANRHISKKRHDKGGKLKAHPTRLQTLMSCTRSLPHLKMLRHFISSSPLPSSPQLLSTPPLLSASPLHTFISFIHHFLPVASQPWTHSSPLHISSPPLLLGHKGSTPQGRVLPRCAKRALYHHKKSPVSPLK